MWVTAEIQCGWCRGWKRMVQDNGIGFSLRVHGAVMIWMYAVIFGCVFSFFVGGLFSFLAGWSSLSDVSSLEISLVVDEVAVFGSVIVFKASREAFLFSFPAFSLHFFSSSTGVNVNHFSSAGRVSFEWTECQWLTLRISSNLADIFIYSLNLVVYVAAHAERSGGGGCNVERWAIAKRVTLFSKYGNHKKKTWNLITKWKCRNKEMILQGSYGTESIISCSENDRGAKFLCGLSPRNAEICRGGAILQCTNSDPSATLEWDRQDEREMTHITEHRTWYFSSNAAAVGGLSSAPPIPARIRSFQWNSSGFRWNEI